MVEDFYKTIKDVAQGQFKDKGSKFLSFAYPVSSEEDVKKIIKEKKKKFHDARHHCYAYRIGLDDNYRANDDGEPSGTAGKPIYGQILSSGLSDILIVVVRYFGGVLLGTGGLINAYKCASIDCISNATIIDKTITSRIHIEFGYDLMSTVMRVLKEEDLNPAIRDFRETCKIALDVRLSELEHIKDKFTSIYGVHVLK